MDASNIIVEVRDVGLNRVGLIPSNYLNIEIDDTFNDVGTWTLSLPAEHLMTPFLQNPGSGIVCTVGNYVFSGPTTQPTNEQTSTDPVGTVTFTGVSDTIILSDALAYPDPTNLTNSSASGYLTGVTETIVHQMVRENIGSTALDARKKAGLIQSTDNGFGSSTAVVYRAFQSVLAACQTVANPDGLGFRVVQRGQNLSFETFATQDRTNSVRLSIHNGEISNQQVATSAPSVTRAIVNGLGWATSRKVVEYSTTDSQSAESTWGRRIEQYINQGSSNVTADLNAAGAEALSDGGSTLLGLKVVPAEDSSLVFGSDWFLGDLVSVETSGVESEVVAKGVIIRANDSGVVAGMIMGDDGAFPDSQGIREVAGLTTRVDSLERVSAGSTVNSVTYYGWQIRGSNSTTITTGVDAQIRFGSSTGTSPDITHDNTTGSGGGRFTVVNDGLYMIQASFCFASSLTNYRRSTLSMNNESTTLQVCSIPGSNTNGTGLVLSVTGRFSAGDNFTLTVGQNSGGNLSSFFASSSIAAANVMITRIG